MKLYISTNRGASGSSFSRPDAISVNLRRFIAQGLKVTWVRNDNNSTLGYNILYWHQADDISKIIPIDHSKLNFDSIEAFQVIDSTGKTYFYSGDSLNANK